MPGQWSEITFPRITREIYDLVAFEDYELHLQFQPGFGWQEGAFRGRRLVLELVRHLLHRDKLDSFML
jgi:hypothetical protein